MVDTAPAMRPVLTPSAPWESGLRSWTLRGARLADGLVADVAIRDGAIVDLGAHGIGEAGAPVIELDGFVLLPGLVEPHAHLDKALTADRVPNARGDLQGAIDAWMAARPAFTSEDIAERARRALLRLVAAGTTAVRTHADTGPDIGIRAVTALLALRDELADVVTLQVVACAARPMTGRAGREARAILDQALDAGADLVGGAPWLEPEPGTAIDHLLGRGIERGLAVDLHLDETLDASTLTIARVLDRLERGVPVRVTASHVVSLGAHAPAVQQRIAERAAAVGLAIVALPLSNLFLQGRDVASSPPRGLTAIRALLGAGVTVAGGGDNLRDPFDPMGRGDPLEIASLLVTAGHLRVDEALVAITRSGRRVLGLPDDDIGVGATADLVAVRATSLIDALGGGSEDRLVWRAGRLVAQTVVERRVAQR